MATKPTGSRRRKRNTANTGTEQRKHQLALGLSHTYTFIHCRTPITLVRLAHPVLQFHRLHSLLCRSMTSSALARTMRRATIALTRHQPAAPIHTTTHTFMTSRRMTTALTLNQLRPTSILSAPSAPSTHSTPLSCTHTTHSRRIATSKPSLQQVAMRASSSDNTSSFPFTVPASSLSAHSPSASTSTPRIVRAKSLTGQHIQDLIDDKILALIIEDYHSIPQCDALANAITSQKNIEQYTHEMVVEEQAEAEPEETSNKKKAAAAAAKSKIVQHYYGVDRVGLPFNLTYNATPSSGIVEQYYNEALSSLLRMRHFVPGSLNPIDKLRLELDERFSAGATVAKFEGRKMLAGMCRITRPNSATLSNNQPHFDALPTRYAKLDVQLAANIYIRMPKVGGELELWDVESLNPLSQTPLDWRAELPEPHIITPKTGELIIFNCRKPHAIRSFEGTPDIAERVTVQMFIGYQNGKPLQLWN